MNNSIEAVDTNGIITVTLSKNSGKVLIDILDNGCGIPEDKLSLVFKQGASFDKKNGSGLGLPFAINKISSWNGDYLFDSKKGEGTQFTIVLPQAKAATWFSEEINLAKNSEIVILDDDAHIHQIWEKRFSEYLINFNELIEFCKTHKTEKTVFLLDQELLNYKENGLILSEMLNIGPSAMLVTSLYEDFNIREACIKLGMKIIPKPYAQFTPIKVLSNIDYVLVDDDETITDIWKDCAELLGKNIKIFNNAKDFMRIFHLYEKEVLIYIDSCLGCGLKGEDIAKILYERGYNNLILTTGFPAENFKEMYWIKNVVGKEPPF